MTAKTQNYTHAKVGGSSNAKRCLWTASLSAYV